jgi:hypothetical protein
MLLMVVIFAKFKELLFSHWKGRYKHRREEVQR